MEETLPGTVSSGISTAVVQLFAKQMGHGPTKAHTELRRNSVLVVLRETLTKGERSLVDAGMSDQVMAMRRLCQDSMRDDLIAAVEQHTSRRVVAFLYDQQVDPDVAAQIFLLEPATEAPV